MNKSVIKEKDGWYWLDETWNIGNGPFKTRKAAIKSQRIYCILELDGLPKEYLNNSDIGYGFGASSGWGGLGTYNYDKDTGLKFWFCDDWECNTEDEKLFNEFMRLNILESIGEL